MSVAALLLLRNQVHSSYAGYGLLAKMTFDVEPETPGKTQCTVLCNLYFLNLSEDACSELLMGFGNLDLHLFFSLPLLLMGKAIKTGISVAVIRRAVVNTSAREGF